MMQNIEIPSHEQCQKLASLILKDAQRNAEIWYSEFLEEIEIPRNKGKELVILGEHFEHFENKEMTAQIRLNDVIHILDGSLNLPNEIMSYIGNAEVSANQAIDDFAKSIGFYLVLEKLNQWKTETGKRQAKGKGASSPIQFDKIFLPSQSSKEKANQFLKIVDEYLDENGHWKKDDRKKAKEVILFLLYHSEKTLIEGLRGNKSGFEKVWQKQFGTHAYKDFGTSDSFNSNQLTEEKIAELNELFSGIIHK